MYFFFPFFFSSYYRLTKVLVVVVRICSNRGGPFFIFFFLLDSNGFRSNYLKADVVCMKPVPLSAIHPNAMMDGKWWEFFFSFFASILLVHWLFWAKTSHLFLLYSMLYFNEIGNDVWCWWRWRAKSVIIIADLFIGMCTVLIIFDVQHQDRSKNSF